MKNELIRRYLMHICSVCWKKHTQQQAPWTLFWEVDQWFSLSCICHSWSSVSLRSWCSQMSFCSSQTWNPSSNPDMVVCFNHSLHHLQRSVHSLWSWLSLTPQSHISVLWTRWGFSRTVNPCFSYLVRQSADRCEWRRQANTSYRHQSWKASWPRCVHCNFDVAEPDFWHLWGV
jgi:hypothetical protein